MSNERSIFKIFKLIIWSIAAGIIVTFFFGTNFLAWATGFNPGGSILFLSPLVCGFILGILTWEYEIYHSVLASILLTTVAIVGTILMLASPELANVADFQEDDYFPIVRNIVVSVVLIFPMALFGSIGGKLITGSAILSPEHRAERAIIRAEADEWYRMLEEYIAAKGDASLTTDQEIRKLIEEKTKKIREEKEYKEEPTLQP